MEVSIGGSGEGDLVPSFLSDLSGGLRLSSSFGVGGRRIPLKRFSVATSADFGGVSSNFSGVSFSLLLLLEVRGEGVCCRSAFFWGEACDRRAGDGALDVTGGVISFSFRGAAVGGFVEGGVGVGGRPEGDEAFPNVCSATSLNSDNFCWRDDNAEVETARDSAVCFLLLEDDGEEEEGIGLRHGRGGGGGVDSLMEGEEETGGRFFFFWGAGEGIFCEDFREDGGVAVILLYVGCWCWCSWGEGLIEFWRLCLSKDLVLREDICLVEEEEGGMKSGVTRKRKAIESWLMSNDVRDWLSDSAICRPNIHFWKAAGMPQSFSILFFRSDTVISEETCT